MQTMKRTCCLVSLIPKTFFSDRLRSDLKWSEWKESNIKGIYIRVVYYSYDKLVAKEGKPAYVWCLQIRNNHLSKIGVSWCVGDFGKHINEIIDHRRNSAIQPGEIETSCIHYTNTPKDGVVSVHLWNLKDYIH